MSEEDFSAKFEEEIMDQSTQIGGKKPAGIMAEHTVAMGEILGEVALHYYGHATKPYYMLIYEANKSVIGDNPNRLKSGITLKIPELPEDMKD